MEISFQFLQPYRSDDLKIGLAWRSGREDGGGRAASGNDSGGRARGGGLSLRPIGRLRRQEGGFRQEDRVLTRYRHLLQVLLPVCLHLSPLPSLLCLLIAWWIPCRPWRKGGHRSPCWTVGGVGSCSKNIFWVELWVDLVHVLHKNFILLLAIAVSNFDLTLFDISSSKVDLDVIARLHEKVFC